MVERFFIDTPVATGQTKKTTFGTVCMVYTDADGTEMLWSAKFPIPTIGATIQITMNKIGPAVVKGYFVCETKDANYIGVMTKPIDPPDWLQRQRLNNIRAHKDDRQYPTWILDGIGCEFGSEVQL
jgi:hypothetical protein